VVQALDGIERTLTGRERDKRATCQVATQQNMSDKKPDSESIICHKWTVPTRLQDQVGFDEQCIIIVHVIVQNHIVLHDHTWMQLKS